MKRVRQKDATVSLAPVNDETADSRMSEVVPARAEGDSNGQYEKIWIEAMAHAWTSLAVVPAIPTISAGPVAAGLAAAAAAYRGEAVRLLRCDEARLEDARALTEAIQSGRSQHGIIISTSAPAQSEVALLLARAADVALVLIPIGLAPVADVRRTIERVGRKKILGAVSLSVPKAR